MAVEHENQKGVKILNESKSRIKNNIKTEIKMLLDDDDLNANYLSEENELIKEHFSRIEKLMRR